MGGSNIDRQVLSLRFRGYEKADIANVLGIKEDRVDSIILRVAKAQADEARIETVREAELAKLEEIEDTFLPKAVSDGDVKAAGVVLKCMERRASLLGADRQVKPSAPTNNFTLVQILAQLPKANNVQSPPDHLNATKTLDLGPESFSSKEVAA